jgi:general secretion pathway protein G
MLNKKQMNMLQSSLHGFTMVELLIVITLVALLSVVGTNIYTSSLASGRDARRRADIEQLRSALELYRSDNPSAVYPTEIATVTQYIKIPKEARNEKDYGYEYLSDGVDYTLGAVLERYTGPTCSAVPTICWTLDKVAPSPVRCNFCVGPYGTK